MCSQALLEAVQQRAVASRVCFCSIAAGMLQPLYGVRLEKANVRIAALSIGCSTRLIAPCASVTIAGIPCGFRTHALIAESDVRTVGQEPSNLEEALNQQLQTVRRPDGEALGVLRVDADTTRGAGSLEEHLARAHSGAVDKAGWHTDAGQGA